MFIIANPKSGNRKGAKIINFYGGTPRVIKMEAKCMVYVFDVTSEVQTILETLKTSISKNV